jgi:hypothetical protein
VLASSHNEVTSSWSRLLGPLPVDTGGLIDRYVDEVAVANQAGTLVVIEGTCISACTIKLSAENRCVRPNAILWFRSASATAFYKGVYLSAISIDGNETFLDFYPPPVRSEVLKHHMLDDRAFDAEHTLTGWELIRLGERNCDDIREDSTVRAPEPADQAPLFETQPAAADKRGVEPVHREGLTRFIQNIVASK